MADDGVSRGDFGFEFVSELLVPLARRAAELVDDPLGELRETVEHPPPPATAVDVDRVEVKTWTDARGHRIIRREEIDKRLPMEVPDVRISAHLDGWRDGVLLRFAGTSYLGPYRAIGPAQARARLLDAWQYAMLERAADARLAANAWPTSNEHVELARALLRDAVTSHPMRLGGGLIAFPWPGRACRFGVQLEWRLGHDLELSVVSPLPREGGVRRLQLIRGYADEPALACPEPPELAARILGHAVDERWRLSVKAPPPRDDVMRVRVQHLEGEGPAAFLSWRCENLSDSSFRGEIQLLLVGRDDEIDAAVERLQSWLAPRDWKLQPFDGKGPANFW